MAGQQDDRARNEDRFGRQDDRRYSIWSSAIAIALAVVAIGLVYFFMR